ncbi:MAG: sugar transferase [Acutalibacteraceae bacterium]|jgi:O-antigen biosynthesis protein WbqP
MDQSILPVTACYIHEKEPHRVFAFVKRAFDLAASLALIVLLLPLMAVVAVIAAADTKGAPIFAQTRMGRNNQPFKMLKFRTMSVNAPANVATNRLHDAERFISPVGAVLRKYSLDELPQLFNILKGDMSMIGPRPVVLTERKLLRLRVENGACSVRPGLTGWSQIHGRDKLPFRDKAALDGYYAAHISLAMDVKILFRTFGYVLHGSDVCEGDHTPANDVQPSRRDRSA